MTVPAASPSSRRLACGACFPGFTLVELLIVMAVLGILAALVVPQFSNASDLARANTMREDLRFLRSQIVVYRAQHRGVSPGYPGGDPAATPTEAALTAQLTQATDAGGATAAAVDALHRFGPYLKRFPENPINGSARVRFIAAGETFPAGASGDEGWVFQPSTGLLAANAAGSDDDQVRYFDY